MAFFDENIITFLSILTIIANVIVLMYIVELIYSKKKNKKLLGDFWKYFGERAVFFSFIVSLVAMVGSLTFSEILHFEPCVLCWYQRILIYPIVFITATALIKKERRIMPYLLVLSVFAAIIAGYHYYGQLDTSTTLPCSALGYSVSCSEQFFLQFGYITIPLMALSAMLLVVVLWHLDREVRMRKI